MMAATAETASKMLEEGLPKNEGPILTVISKKIRALRKKANKITQIEDAKNAGKPINKEQDEVLRSKASVWLLLDEYEKLRHPLSAALKEELDDSEKAFLKAALERRAAAAEAEKEAEKSIPEQENFQSEVLDQASPLEGAPSVASSGSDLSDLIELLYFAALFDIGNQGDSPLVRWSKEQERSACLSYDFVADDSVTPLTAADLDNISIFSQLLQTRAPNVANHKEAYENCMSHAQKFCSGSEEVINADLNVTYGELKDRLKRIIASDYFIKKAADVNPELVVAVGQYINDGNGMPVYTVEDQQGMYVQQDLGTGAQYYSNAYENYAVAPAPGGTMGLIGESEQSLAPAIPAYVPDGSYSPLDPAQQQYAVQSKSVPAPPTYSGPVEEGLDSLPTQESPVVQPTQQQQQQYSGVEGVAGGRNNYGGHNRGPRGGGGYGGRGRGGSAGNNANGEGYRGGRRGRGQGRGTGGQGYEGGYHQTGGYRGGPGRGRGRGGRGGPQEANGNGAQPAANESAE